MAGVYKAQSTRGRYSQAGYTYDADMYIAAVPAGSAQDALRDYNREGYRSERPWHETPDPVFEQPVSPRTNPPAARKKTKQKKPQTFLDGLSAQAWLERRDVAACILFGALILIMLAAGGQQMIRSVKLQNTINAYQEDTKVFEQENEQLAQQLELARGGERIRNEAQNKLGMLRPERAQTETIYIRTAENAGQKALQNTEEPRMELLDILLGLLNVLHIGE